MNKDNLTKEAVRLHGIALEYWRASRNLEAMDMKNIARFMMTQALRVDSDAADMLINEDIEPLRSGLYLSAALIAKELGLNGDADRLSREGLRGKHPSMRTAFLSMIMPREGDVFIVSNKCGIQYVDTGNTVGVNHVCRQDR